MDQKEQLNFVIIGHVDHGKSTVIGRLLADTHSLPEGKLESIKAYCQKNSRVFEYAFLLDALKEEQAQGITMDSARCFFKTEKREYMIIDAPGHVEFIKNMITGAARASAALVVIDIKEGIQENTRRHGYILSLLGIKQVTVVVNKMDLSDYNEEAFLKVSSDYKDFLAQVGVYPISFIPLSARSGENIISRSTLMPWYKGKSLLEQIESFDAEIVSGDQPFRFPVQDVYKFTSGDDDRRILAGTIAQGSVNDGEEVIFYPSKKKSKIRTIEVFGKNPSKAVVGEASGFTLEHPLYIQPGELMVKRDDPSQPYAGRYFLASFFWMGTAPLLLNRNYKLKIGAASVTARIVKLNRVMDASELTESKKSQLDRYDVAECVIETLKPIAFDKSIHCRQSGCFVLIDDYHIAGCGIVLDEAHEAVSSVEKGARDRDIRWDRGRISQNDREAKHGHRGRFVVISGLKADLGRKLAILLEKRLFDQGRQAYYLGVSTILEGLEKGLPGELNGRDELIIRLGELARILTDSGQIMITALEELDASERELLRILNAPAEIILVSTGGNEMDESGFDLVLPTVSGEGEAADKVLEFLSGRDIIPDYYL